LRPALVADCLFAPGDEMVLVRSNRGTFTLNGRHVASWLEKLAPHLDGRRSIETLTANLPAGQRDSVVKLVGMLADQGVVRDLDRELPHDLPDEDLAAWASEIDYVDSLGGSGPHHFGRFRGTRVVVAGPAATAGLIAEAARELGSRRLEIVASDASPAADLPDHPEPTEVVVGCDGADRAPRLAALNRTCWVSGRTLLPVVIGEDAAWIGPVVRPGRAGCWECAWRRLDQRDRRAGRDPGRLGPTAGAILATRAAMEVLRLVTGAGTLPSERGLVRLDLETGLSRRHPFHPHPLCQVCGGAETTAGGDLLNRWSAYDGRAEQRPEELLRLADDLVDPCCGILRSLGEDELPQLPFNAARAVASAPGGGGDEPLVAMGTGETRSDSRERAVHRALSRYAHALCEGRLASSAPEAGTWAWDLVADAPALVPPGSPSNVHRLATGAGRTWSGAVGAALFEHAIRLAVAFDRREGGLPPIDVEDLARSHPGSQSPRIAAIAGVRPTLIDTTSEVGVPSAAAVVEGRLVAYAAARDLAGAAELALEGAVAHFQVSRFGRAEPEARVEAVAGRETNLAIALRLAERGWRSFAIPMDQDAAVAAACPNLAAVVLLPFTGAIR
jgi:bacteriocin biosynthesis cyclodehydratase domain-containing protein